MGARVPGRGVVLSAILDLADRRTAVVDVCERMGLQSLGAELGTKRGDTPGILREMLLRVRIAATAIHAAVAHEHAIVPGAAVLTRMATNALELEREACAAIVACDRVIQELAESNARGAAPGLPSLPRGSSRSYR